MNRCTRCQKIYQSVDKYCGECGLYLQDGDLQSVTAMTRIEVGLNDIRFNLGMVYFKKNKLNEAIEVWKNVLKEEPNHLDAQSMIKEADERLSVIGGRIE